MNERAIFIEALEKSSADQRGAYLDEACAGDTPMRRRVEALLESHDLAGSFMDKPVPERLAEHGVNLGGTVDEPLLERTGTVIGPYKLMEQIGEGGMGLVFVAEQQHPVRRKVAVKVIKPGMDTRDVVARFEAERQALALMDHPNIARVFDAGATESGRPYFVMELVRGVGIAEFCDENRLTPRERLELFVHVCQAVQHAHQKGIIHRDLKATNILVTLHDGTPVVKVIDFGVAKAIGQQLTDKTIYTRFAQMIGTPMYMSPEQAEMSGLDIDTRSDIYALGVLLYELLTGATPFDKERLKTASYDEIRRIVREEEPPRPSQRISTLLEETLTVVSARRKTEPARLSQVFRGELDWIVMKALEKDRNRRYETASAFAADVQRYLHDEPVQACPPTVRYRLQKFARKYRTLLVTAGAFAFLLVGGSAVSVWQAVRATLAEGLASERLVDVKDANVKTTQALADKTDKLWTSLLERARAKRMSGRVGQRFQALKAIREASEIRITPELRDEAVAALALPDVEIVKEWDCLPDDTWRWTCSASFEHFAYSNKNGDVTVGRLTDKGMEVRAKLEAHGESPFNMLTMSADGRYLVYGHSCVEEGIAGEFRVWDLDGPSGPTVLFDEHEGLMQWAVAFHKDGQRLAVGHANGTISIYSLADGERVRRLTLDQQPQGMAFSARNGRLAVTCGNIIRLFDVDSGKELAPLVDPRINTWHFPPAWHPDGRCLAASCDDFSVHIWDTETGKRVMAPLEGHVGSGVTMAFNPQGDRLISAGWDGSTKLWDAVTGRLLFTISGTSVGSQFSKDGRSLGLGRSGTKLRKWRLADGRELRFLRRATAKKNEIIVNPLMSADGRVLAAGSSDGLCFFDLDSGKDLGLAPLPTHAGSAVHPRCFDTSSSSWLTCGSAGLLLWPTQQDPAQPGVLRIGPPKRLEGPSDDRAGASKDGRIIALPQRSRTLVLDRNNPDRPVVIEPLHDVRICAVSPDGQWVVTCGWFWDGRSNNMRIWEAKTGRHVADLPSQGYSWADFSPDGRCLATNTAGQGCQLWEVGTWQPRTFFRDAAFFCWHQNADNQLLALSDPTGLMRLIEPNSGREVSQLNGPELNNPRFFSPDGSRLIAEAYGNHTLYVWDLRLIRTHLKEMGLDWDWPEFPAAGPRKVPVSKVEIDLGDLAKLAPTHEQRSQQAIDHYRRVVKANPNDAKACNQLAWVYLTAPKALCDVKAAVPLAENAMRLAGGNADYRNTLGVAYYRAERYREAIDTLRPNLDKQMEKYLGADLYFLAMSHYRLGESARAQDYLVWANRWTAAQRDLAPAQLEELHRFRAEAMELLNKEPKKTKSPPGP